MSVEIDRDHRVIEQSWLRGEEHDAGLERERYGPAFDRSLVQRLEALKVANDVRSRRARLKKDIATRRADPVAAVMFPPKWLETAHLEDVLLAIPWWGRVKVNRMLVHWRISPSKTVGGLSDRQRREVVSYLRGT